MLSFKKNTAVFLCALMLILTFLPSFSAFASQEIGVVEIEGYTSLKSEPVVYWQKAEGADKYRVYRSSSEDGEYKKIGTTSNLSFTDKDAKERKSYFYKVRPIKIDGDNIQKGEISNIIKIKAKRTVLVGDSIMEGVKYYKALPGGKFVVKIGMGTYTFCNSNYFKHNGHSVTGLDKVIAMKPDRIFIMLGMNEAAYKGNKAILEYYDEAISAIKDELPKAEIIVLPVSPTKADSGKSIPKKKRIDSFNKELKKTAKNQELEYFDYTEIFEDKNGYLLNKYDGGDGCHWTPSGTKAFVKELTEYAKSNP